MYFSIKNCKDIMNMPFYQLSKDVTRAPSPYSESPRDGAVSAGYKRIKVEYVIDSLVYKMLMFDRSYTTDVILEKFIRRVLSRIDICLEYTDEPAVQKIYRDDSDLHTVFDIISYKYKFKDDKGIYTFPLAILHGIDDCLSSGSDEYLLGVKEELLSKYSNHFVITEDEKDESSPLYKALTKPNSYDIGIFKSMSSLINENTGVDIKEGIVLLAEEYDSVQGVCEDNIGEYIRLFEELDI